MPKSIQEKKGKETKTPIRKGTKIRITKSSTGVYPSSCKGDIAVILYEQKNVVKKKDSKKKELLRYVAVCRKMNKGRWDFSSHSPKFVIQENEFEIIKPVNKDPKNSKTLICEVCETRKKRELFKKHKGFLICDNCFDKYFRYCRDCGKCIPHNDAYDLNDDTDEIICRECYETHYSQCHRCERLFPRDEVHNGMCDDCRNEYNRNNNIIVPDDKRFVDKSTQERDLPIGVEIEAELKEDGDFISISNGLRNTGCGVCEDGSLSNGVEVQIPASNNGITERLVNNACRILQRYCYIEDTCGLHIHIGYPADLTALKNAIIMAYISEPVFYGVNPRSREHSRFCLSIRNDFNLKEILNVKPDTIDKLLYSKRFGKGIRKNTIEAYKKEKYNSCRYSGFNLHSHFYRGTLEFRYHSGTIDPVKIMNWANLLKTILIYAKKSFIKKNVLEIEHSKTYEERSGRLFNIIGLSTNLKQYFTERYKRFHKAKKEIEEKVKESGSSPDLPPHLRPRFEDFDMGEAFEMAPSEDRNSDVQNQGQSNRERRSRIDEIARGLREDDDSPDTHWYPRPLNSEEMSEVTDELRL